jgi:hypothetical protein
MLHYLYICSIQLSDLSHPVPNSSRNCIGAISIKDSEYIELTDLYYPTQTFVRQLHILIQNQTQLLTKRFQKSVA